ncbi:chemotaxis protein CheA [Sphingorhabdus arenilitoris]|uniref:histidine kinase n=1 Tax=Sphingorhabdus arenilitoris TaxID=1490041 RepID=A0ABV8RF25_9SPHN
MDDLLEEFIAETRETLELLSGQLVQWEKEPDDRGLVDSVFRFVHTVKGSCGFLDLPRLLRLSHAAEDLLSSARDGNLSPTTDLVTAVLAVIDRISDLTDALESGRSVHDNDEELIDAMLAFIPKGSDGDRVGTVIDPSEAVKQMADIDLEIADGMVGNPKSRSVRVSLQLLDKLMNGVSDMVLARNEVSRQLRKSHINSELDHSFGRLSSSVAEMRDAVGLMRMQHIDRLFSSLPRLLRDISQELGKDIDLQIEGSEVEVDREMVEALRDPLTHILRNAADHGIETAEERKRLGKSPNGLIKITARQSGNQIMIEIADDGRGIDLEKLATKAISAKLITAAQWQKMSEKAQLATIFMPGLSTAETVSSISGRGVGMDVVKTNLQAIGGTIDLENFEGHGLKMTLRLPLTLSIIAGLSVKVGDQIFGISRSSVVEILSLSNKNVEIENVGGTSIARIRGTRMPYAKAEEILGLEAVKNEKESSRTLIVIRPAIGATFALDVAAVIDNEELVVKPGAPLVMATGLYAGASLPDNGRPMLLLDSSGLAAAIGIDLQDKAYADEQMVNEQDNNKDRLAALLFIGIDGRKSAIRLSVIDRMEDFPVEKISFSGGKLRAASDGALIEIFGLEKVPEQGDVQMLRLSDGSDSKYLAVSEVLDIFSIHGDIVTSALPDLHEGIIQVDGEMIELINPFQFFEDSQSNRFGNGKRPLCYVEAREDDLWERRILEPLLIASGYRVSYDAADRDKAEVVLGKEDSDTPADIDGRMLRLRDSSFAAPTAHPSIYRYDRVGLISAIEHKLAGGR